MSKDSYEVIAPYYNEIMEHVDYDKWGRYISSIIKKFKIKTHSVLELASGTGRLKEVWGREFPIFILSDLSLPMLSFGKKPNSIVMDMKELALKPSSLDFVFCLYDSFNYLLTEDDVLKCFTEVYEVAKPGAAFLFDIITEDMCLDYFDDHLDFQESESGVHILRQSNYDIKNKYQENRFTYFIPSDEEWFVKKSDFHRQKIWTVDQLESLWLKAGWELEKIMGDFTTKTACEESLRFNILIKKL